MVKVTTSSGFGCEIDPSVLDDMELFDAVVQLQEGDATALPTALSRILTPAQKKELYDHNRDETGRVRVSKITNELNDIFLSIGAAGKK